MKLRHSLAQQKLIPVLVLEQNQDINRLAECFLKQGLNHLEITLRTPSALTVIEQLNHAYPELSIAAGTVMNAQQAQQAIDAGATFLVSPGTTPALIDSMKPFADRWIPAAVTLSEVMLLNEHGFECIKFFPAELQGGIKWLQGTHALLPKVSFFPTGGINLSNIAHYWEQPNVLCVGGTWLATTPLIEQQRWGEIDQLIQSTCQLRDKPASR